MLPGVVLSCIGLVSLVISFIVFLFAAIFARQYVVDYINNKDGHDKFDINDAYVVACIIILAIIAITAGLFLICLFSFLCFLIKNRKNTKHLIHMHVFLWDMQCLYGISHRLCFHCGNRWKRVPVQMPCMEPNMGGASELHGSPFEGRTKKQLQ